MKLGEAIYEWLEEDITPITERSKNKRLSNLKKVECLFDRDMDSLAVKDVREVLAKTSLGERSKHDITASIITLFDYYRKILPLEREKMKTYEEVASEWLETQKVRIGNEITQETYFTKENLIKGFASAYGKLDSAKITPEIVRQWVLSTKYKSKNSRKNVILYVVAPLRAGEGKRDGRWLQWLSGSDVAQNKKLDILPMGGKKVDKKICCMVGKRLYRMVEETVSGRILKDVDGKEYLHDPVDGLLAEIVCKNLDGSFDIVQIG